MEFVTVTVRCLADQHHQCYYYAAQVTPLALQTLSHHTALSPTNKQTNVS